MKHTWIWLHGFGTSPAVWGEPASWMPGARHRMFSYANCDTIGQMRERLHVMIREESEPVTLIGWSFGGMLALETAIAQWEQSSAAPAGSKLPTSVPAIAQLVLVSATPRFVGTDRTKSWPDRIVRRMRSQLALDPDATLRAFAESMLAAEERTGGKPDVAQWMARLYAATDFSPSGLDAALAYLQETDLTERWERFVAGWRGRGLGCLSAADEYRPDVVWLHGEEDPICPIGAIADIPSQEKIIFPGAGHAPFLTSPEPFAEAIRRIVHGDR